jgi:hypothetical protein
LAHGVLLFVGVLTRTNRHKVLAMWQRAADARQLERRARMAARASDSHLPGQLNDSRGSMPASILPAPPAAVKGKLAMSQNLRAIQIST